MTKALDRPDREIGHPDRSELSRAELERHSAEVRARLLRRIDVLDRRRREAVRLKHEAERLVIPAGILVVAVVGASVVTAVGVHHLWEARRRRRPRVLLAKLGRYVRDRIEALPERRTRTRRLGEQLLVGLATIAVRRLALHLARRSLQASPPRPTAARARPTPDTALEAHG